MVWLKFPVKGKKSFLIWIFVGVWGEKEGHKAVEHDKLDLETSTTKCFGSESNTQKTLVYSPLNTP